MNEHPDTFLGISRRLLGALPSIRLLLALAATLIVFFLLSHAGFRFQSSTSGPRGIWQFKASSITHGAWVAICSTADIAALSRDRGYLGPGPCAGGVAPMLKRVVAMPGDVVDLTPAGMAVNGKRVQQTAIRSADQAGRPLPHPPWGTHAVQSGTIWVANPRADSFDSRYFGPVDMSKVLSVVDAVLVEKVPVEEARTAKEAAP
jgi:conjugative transfer signal peptidase TraF